MQKQRANKQLMNTKSLKVLEWRGYVHTAQYVFWHNNPGGQILLSPYCSEIFPTLLLSYWGAHSYYPTGPIIRKGNSSSFKYGPDRWVSVHWAVKFYNLFTFILGAHSYYPRGPIGLIHVSMCHNPSGLGRIFYLWSALKMYCQIQAPGSRLQAQIFS